jgi:hypothetical protein
LSGCGCAKSGKIPQTLFGFFEETACIEKKT